MNTPAIHRYEVPVDDQWHGYDLGGDVLHVSARNPRIVLAAAEDRAVRAEQAVVRLDLAAKTWRAKARKWKRAARLVGVIEAPTTTKDGS
jgi:hypothetical protein